MNIDKLKFVDWMHCTLEGLVSLSDKFNMQKNKRNITDGTNIFENSDFLHMFKISDRYGNGITLLRDLSHLQLPISK